MQKSVKVPNNLFYKLKKTVKVFDIISYFIFLPIIVLLLIALALMHDTYGLYNLSNFLMSIHLVAYYLGACLILLPLALAFKIASFLITVHLGDDKNAVDPRFEGVILAIFMISFFAFYYFLMYQRFIVPINHGAGI